MFDLHYTTATSNYKQTFESLEDICREIAIFSTSKEIISWEAFDEQGKCIGHLDKNKVNNKNIKKENSKSDEWEIDLGVTGQIIPK